MSNVMKYSQRAKSKKVKKRTLMTCNISLRSPLERFIYAYYNDESEENDPTN